MEDEDVQQINYIFMALFGIRHIFKPPYSARVRYAQLGPKGHLTCKSSVEPLDYFCGTAYDVYTGWVSNGHLIKTVPTLILIINLFVLYAHWREASTTGCGWCNRRLLHLIKRRSSLRQTLSISSYFAYHTLHHILFHTKSGVKVR